MNISTYEARIKALEDQLNPPAPGGSTGLLSVTVSPDITLSDGTSLNAKLAAMMPIRWEDGEPAEGMPETVRVREITINSDEAPEQPEQVSITVTPSSGCYAYTVSQTDGQTTFGEKDEPVSATMAKVRGLDALIASFGAAAANSMEAASRIMSVSFRINY